MVVCRNEECEIEARRRLVHMFVAGWYPNRGSSIELGVADN